MHDVAPMTRIVEPGGSVGVGIDIVAGIGVIAGLFVCLLR